jgi:hypothetical protein
MYIFISTFRLPTCGLGLPLILMGWHQWQWHRAAAAAMMKKMTTLTLIILSSLLHHQHVTVVAYDDPWNCAVQNYTGECCYPTAQPMPLPAITCPLGELVIHYIVYVHIND